MLLNKVLYLIFCNFCYHFHCLAFKFESDEPHDILELSYKTHFICHTHFSKRTTAVTLSAEVETDQARYLFNDFSDKLLKQTERVKVQVDTFGYHHARAWDYYNIIYVDSASSFRRINPGEKTKKQDHSEHYLVILRPTNYEDYLEEMESIFAYCWSYYIINISILLEDQSGVVRIFTYFPFTNEKCSSTSAVELFSFEKFIDIFPSKVSNLHQCKLVGAFWQNPPYISWNSSTGLERFFGMEGNMVKAIATKMNFSLEIITPPNGEMRGLIFNNGTVSGAIKMLQERDAQLSLGCFRCTLQRSIVLSSTKSFYQTFQVYFVRAYSQPWTTFEIMFYPFDSYIWTIMLTMLVAAVIINSYFKHFKPEALDFMSGTQNKSAGNIFHLVCAWLGFQVVPEPKRNFARFILTLWLFATLVLRSSYQGQLYNFLNSKEAKPPPNTAHQLVEQKYQMIASISSYDTLSEVPIIRDRLVKVVVKKMSEEDAFLVLENTSQKVVTSLPRDFLGYHVLKTKKYGVFHVLKETIFTHQICIYFTKHSFLTEKFNDMISQLRSFGLIDLWASQSIAPSVGAPKVSGNSIKIPLSMHQLNGCFIIMIVCSTLATVVFVLELLSVKYAFLRKWFE